MYYCVYLYLIPLTFPVSLYFDLFVVVGFLMGRLCFPDQLDSSARPGPHVDWQILSQDLCGLLCCKYTYVGQLTNLCQICIHKSFIFNKVYCHFTGVLHWNHLVHADLLCWLPTCSVQ